MIRSKNFLTFLFLPFFVFLKGELCFSGEHCAAPFGVESLHKLGAPNRPQLIHRSFLWLRPKAKLLEMVNNSVTNVDRLPWSTLIRLIRQMVIEEGTFRSEPIAGASLFYREASWTKTAKEQKNKSGAYGGKSDRYDRKSTVRVASRDPKREAKEIPEDWVLEFEIKETAHHIHSVTRVSVHRLAEISGELSDVLEISFETLWQSQNHSPSFALKNAPLLAQLPSFRGSLSDLFDFVGPGAELLFQKKAPFETLNKNNLFDLVSKIKNPHRQYPVVLVSSFINPRGRPAPRPLVDLYSLSKSVVGVAEVYYLETNTAAYRELIELLGGRASLLASGGDIRLLGADQIWRKEEIEQLAASELEWAIQRRLMESLGPKGTNHANIQSENQRIELLRETDEQRKRAEELQNQLNEIDKKIRNHALQGRVALSSLQDELNGIHHRVIELEQFGMDSGQNSLKQTADSLKVQVEILQEDLVAIGSFAPHVDSKHSSARGEAQSGKLIDFANPPDTVEQMIELVRAKYHSQIGFAGEAYNAKSLGTFLTQKPHRQILLKTLVFAATELREIYLGREAPAPGAMSADLMKVDFRKRALEQGIGKLNLAISESNEVKKNGDLRNQRVGSYGGRVYLGLAHIKYDGGPNNIFRIHFAFDSKLKMIIVTRIVQHLEVFRSNW